MAIATISETIARAQISIYLSGNYVAKGELFGARKAPCSPVTINIINDALSWGNSGGAQTIKDVRQMSNYLVWLIGMFGQEAQNTIAGGGGGSLTPINPPVTSLYPIIINGSNFESDGLTYNNPQIVGDSVYIYIGGFDQELHFSPNDFVYTPTGIQIVIPGFDANNFPYIEIQKYST